MKLDVQSLARSARLAAPGLAASTLQTRNQALLLAARALEENKEAVFAANGRYIARSQAEGLAAPLIKRLKFDEEKLAVALAGIKALCSMQDPLGRTLYAMEMDSGLDLYRISCPIGVVGIIFESRPDALVQIGTLCLKSGNCVLLKGGREAMETNRVLFGLLYGAALEAGLPQGSMALLETREDIGQMLGQDAFIDLIIPRGSNEFVRYIMDNSRIPVLGHADGICHIYAHEDAPVDMAVSIIEDSKTQYVAVCNAVETLLVHSAAAPELLPQVARALQKKGVELRGCERTRAVIACKAAGDADWDTEYLDYILSIRVVDSLEEAAAHINTHGSHHTDGIITRDERAAAAFIAGVDSADVFVNASTRLADGYCYGLGAEVGIATGRTHARGPMGMEGLLIYKYVLLGNGHLKAHYGPGGRSFTHKPIKGGFPYGNGCR